MSTRDASPAKKAWTETVWEVFLDALSAKNVKLSDVDFGLHQELRSFCQAQSDFLALNLPTPKQSPLWPQSKANYRNWLATTLLTSSSTSSPPTASTRTSLRHGPLHQQHSAESELLYHMSHRWSLPDQNPYGSLHLLMTSFSPFILSLNPPWNYPVTLDYKVLPNIEVTPVEVGPRVQTFRYPQEWQQLTLRVQHVYKAFSSHCWWFFLCCYIPYQLIQCVLPTVYLRLSPYLFQALTAQESNWRYLFEEAYCSRSISTCTGSILP